MIILISQVGSVVGNFCLGSKSNDKILVTPFTHTISANPKEVKKWLS